MIGSLRVTAFAAATVVVLILVFVARGAAGALVHLGPLGLVSDSGWYPDEGLYGLLSMLVGSLLVTALAVLAATPLGVMAAVLIEGVEADPRARPVARLLARTYRRVLELLAGVPSVVLGVWGLVALVPVIAKLEPPGTSLLAAAVVLALMILPTIALVAASSLAGVPHEVRKGAAALGLSPWATMRGVLLPSALPGILSGVFLGTARAIGETMAVLMVAGNVVQLPDSLFSPVRTLTANIALEMSYAMGDHRSALFVSGLVLLIAVAALVLAAELAGRRLSHG